MFDFECPECGHVERDRIVKSRDAEVRCPEKWKEDLPTGGHRQEFSFCNTVMVRLDGLPSVRVGMGFTADSRAAYNSKLRTQQEAKRVKADRSTEGQQQKAEALLRQKKAGNFLATKPKGV